MWKKQEERFFFILCFQSFFSLRFTIELETEGGRSFPSWKQKMKKVFPEGREQARGVAQTLFLT